MIFGLGAALGWGLSDLWAALSGRRIGSGRTVVTAQIVATIAASALLVAVRPEMSGLAEVAPWLVPNAFLSAAAFFTLYRALQLGPIAIVSPILATYAVVTVFLSLVLLDESLGAVEATGAAVTIGGAVLTSTDLRALRSGTSVRAPGVPWAIASTIMFGGATYVMGWAARTAGILPSLWLGKILMVTVFLAAALVDARRRGGEPNAGGGWRAGLTLSAAVGLAELLGTFAYARGAEVGLLSIVTAASATYPLIPVLGGVTLLRERPSPNQVVGIVLVTGGLLLLGLA